MLGLPEWKSSSVSLWINIINLVASTMPLPFDTKLLFIETIHKMGQQFVHISYNVTIENNKQKSVKVPTLTHKILVTHTMCICTCTAHIIYIQQKNINLRIDKKDY